MFRTTRPLTNAQRLARWHYLQGPEKAQAERERANPPRRRDRYHLAEKVNEGGQITITNVVSFK